jgi:hypothetical protein
VSAVEGIRRTPFSLISGTLLSTFFRAERSVHLTGVHRTGMHLTGVYLTGVHRTRVHRTGVHLIPYTVDTSRSSGSAGGQAPKL